MPPARLGSSRVRPSAVLAGVGRDRVDDLRPQRTGQVVAHALDHQQLGAGDRPRRCARRPPASTSGSTSPWMTRVGTSSCAQALGRGARGEDGGQLAGDARRGRSSGRRLGRPARRQLVLVEAGRGCRSARAACVDAGGRCRSSRVGGRRLEQRRDGLGLGVPDVGSPVVDMIDVSVRTRSGCSMAMSGRSSRPSTRRPRGPARRRGRRAGRRRRRPCRSSRYGTSTSSPSRRPGRIDRERRRPARPSILVDRPTSRLSKRTTGSPGRPAARRSSVSQAIIWAPRPMTSRSVGPSGRRRSRSRARCRWRWRRRRSWRSSCSLNDRVGQADPATAGPDGRRRT